MHFEHSHGGLNDALSIPKWSDFSYKCTVNGEPGRLDRRYALDKPERPDPIIAIRGFSLASIYLDFFNLRKISLSSPYRRFPILIKENLQFSSRSEIYQAFLIAMYI